MKPDPSPEDYFYDPIHGFRSQGKEASAVRNKLDFVTLPPLLRTVLVSDGTVTKILEAYYWEPVQVETIFHGETILTEDLPALDLHPGQTVLLRKVRLRGIRSKRIYDYAESHIQTDLLWPGVKEDLLRERLGIGEVLRDQRVETYRELLDYGRRMDNALCPVLEVPDNEELLFRNYRIFVNQRPALHISDTFPVSHFEERS